MTININDKQKSNWLVDHKISLISIVNPHFSILTSSKHAHVLGHGHPLKPLSLPPSHLTLTFLLGKNTILQILGGAFILEDPSFTLQKKKKKKNLQIYHLTQTIYIYVLFYLSFYLMVSDRHTVTIIE